MKHITPAALPPLEITAAKPTAVITCAVGPDGEMMHRITRAHHIQYARKLDADFHIISGPATDFSIAEKFRIGQYLDHYDRIIFLDADTVVDPDTPNLFELVPREQVGMHNDTPYLPANWNIWGEYDALCRSQGELPLPRDRLLCLNTGVIVASKQHKDIFRPLTRPYNRTHCSEQNWISMNVIRGGHGLYELPMAFNWGWWIYGQPGRVMPITPEEVYIWHASGYRVPFLKGEWDGGWAPYAYRSDWLKKRSREIWEGRPPLSWPEPVRAWKYDFPWEVPGSEWQVYEEAQLLLENCGMRHLEVGSYSGFSARVAAMSKIVKEITCCDYFTDKNPCGLGVSVEQFNSFTAGITKKMEVLVGSSSERLPELKGRQFDSAFIDGDHSYKSCKQDIELALPLMAPHGVLIFHDYASYFDGVIHAVDEAVIRYGWKPIDQAYSMRAYRVG